MEYTYIKNGIEALVIDDFFSKQHLKLVLDECKKLIPVMLSPKDTGGAKDETDQFYIKENSGIFIDDKNPIYYASANVTTSDAFKMKLMEFNPMWKMYSTINTSSTLVSYYKNSDHYAKHTDLSLFTILIWVNAEPKKFTGGDLTLYAPYPNVEASVEYKNNRAIIFPSCTQHSVSPVQETGGLIPDGSGRFCITHFLNYVTPPRK